MPLQNTSPDLRRTNWIIVLLVLVGVVLASLPVALHLPAPPGAGFGAIFAYLPAILAAALCFIFDRTISKREKVTVLLLCVLLTFLTTYLHIWVVDRSAYFRTASNLEWQIYTQNAVIQLSPDALPHSYRFLPNSIVRLFEQVAPDYTVARDSYRNLFGVLLFYSFYRYARLFLQHGGSLLCLALLTAVLPVSFRNYAGQLTDPISHLSFVLAFIFIETEQFAYLLLTIIIGCLAKETIIAMAGYYALFRWREKLYLLKGSVLVLAGIGVFLGTRLFVLHGFPHYAQISGPEGLDHVVENWNDYPIWLPAAFYTAGIFLPFVLAGWRQSPWTLRSLAIYWVPVIFLSGLFFSWLREARNFVPLSLLFIVMAVYRLMPGERVGPMREQVTVTPVDRPPEAGRKRPRKQRR